MTFRRRKAPQAPVVVPKSDVSTVPPALRIAGEYSWRILLVVGVLSVLIFLVIQLREILVPFMIAVLVGALLVPFVQWLMRHRWPKPLAISVAMLGSIAVITGLIVVVVTQIRIGYPDLQSRSVVAFENFKQFLADSPLHVDDQQLNGFIDQTIAAFQQDGQVLWTGALSLGVTAGHLLAGLLLAIFATLFILIDGKRIWAWMVRLFPRTARPAVDGSGHAGWITLTTFVKVQIFVAAVDATGIGLGAWILGLVFGGFPLVFPIAIAVFLGSFIPIVGALITGTLAVFVALIYLGPFPAVLMLGIVLLVQQVEGHVLQPLIMGSAVKIHPLAVVFAVASGSYLAGIPGALFAVPVIAVLNVVVKYIAGGAWKTNPHPTAEDLLPNA